MRCKALGFLSLVLIVTPSFAALKQGDTAPDFKAQASLAGKDFSFSLRDEKLSRILQIPGGDQQTLHIAP